MTVKYIMDILEHFPGDMPVNVHIEYGSGVILRAPGVEINYVDKTGTIIPEPTQDVKEISFFVVESLASIKRKLKNDD